MFRWIANLFGTRKTLTVEQELEAQRRQIAGLIAGTNAQLSR